MPVEYVNGKPVIKGIPRGSTLCISALPERREVLNIRANGSFTPAELDPGKYIYTINKSPIFNNPQRVWQERGEFLVDVDEIGYQKLLYIRARYARGVMTSQGARWTCGISGCAEQFTSLVSAVKHEGDHLGVDFLTVSADEAEEAILKMHKAGKITSQESNVVASTPPKPPPTKPFSGFVAAEDLITR